MTGVLFMALLMSGTLLLLGWATGLINFGVFQ